MLRIRHPVRAVASRQLAKLADIARRYDAVWSFTTRRTGS